ncbi:MAG: Uncharacterized protein G01um101456_140 [Parcubacteria group bacterium Gr01-1014_56]|nr:MAG: Uncharacterized protein G01um101456_140 [Parcubacteria group bacterium Gr01-1014_56]
MELYSKRNEVRLYRNQGVFLRQAEREEDSFLADPVRKRLLQLIKYISKTDKYLERFLLVNDEVKKEYYFYELPIKELTLMEAGYDITEFINFESLELKTEKKCDSKVFDLIELVLIFAQKEKREDLVERFNKIFKEENCKFALHSFMIINTESSGLRSIAPIVKEKLLKQKIYHYYQQQRVTEPNFEVSAKTSAEILQLIFSSPKSKEKTKDYAEKLCVKVAERWTGSANVKKLASLLSETVKNSKELSNQISDVRHTDRTTIPVDTPNIYKLIASKNINIAELIILSMPEVFIAEQDPESLKANYLSAYEVNKATPWVIKKRKVDDLEIDHDNIPF